MHGLWYLCCLAFVGHGHRLSERLDRASHFQSFPFLRRTQLDHRYTSSSRGKALSVLLLHTSNTAVSRNPSAYNGNRVSLSGTNSLAMRGGSQTSVGNVSERARMSPSILHEDAHILVVYKPFGISYHSEDSPGLLQRIRNMRNGGELAFEGDLHSVHRLDKITSGIVLFAKSAHVASLLSNAFAKRQVDKYYVGLSERRPSKKMGIVKGDLRISRRGSWKLTREQKNPAVTKFRSFAVKGTDGRSLRAFIFKPLTGKTHQLRVTAKSLGAPVLGDARYAETRAAEREDRAYLHAAAIRVPPLWEGHEGLQVISTPVEGIQWHGASWFTEMFPKELASFSGEWFSDDPLLRSCSLSREIDKNMVAPSNGEASFQGKPTSTSAQRFDAHRTAVAGEKSPMANTDIGNERAEAPDNALDKDITNTNAIANRDINIDKAETRDAFLTKDNW